jgi:hypothetical protein
VEVIGKRREKRKKSGVVVTDATFGGGARKYISGFYGSQAVPAPPSGRDNA